MSERADEIVGVSHLTSKTTFGTITQFERVQEKTIKTNHFLQACTDLTGILDHLGTSFTIARKDMLGNIKKINDHYKRDTQLFTTLNAILEEESHAQVRPAKTAVGVIWLKRALEFLRSFLSELSKEHWNSTQEESLRQTVLRAYEGTLRPYHGVMTQFLFSNISRLVPYRKTLLKTLMLEQNATVDMVISDIDVYLINFSDTLDLLEELLGQYGLRSQEKV